MRNLRSMLQGELSNWLILSTLLVQIILLVTLSQRVGNLEKLIAGPESEPVARIPDEQGHVKGSDDAYITLVEFSDFQCPHCANAESILSQIISDHPGNIRFLYRHYPLTSIHPYAFQAAEASECANEQGKFWEMHDYLFENQLNYPEDEASLMEFFSGLADEIGIDVALFRSCLANQTYVEYITKDMNDGANYGVKGTPAFFVNKQIVMGASNLEAVIEEALKEAK